MALLFHPKPGMILECDFTTGFVAPEMVKRRPVIVVSPALAGRDRLATVIAISSKRPPTEQDYHFLLPKNALPQLGIFQAHESWVKGDMVYTASFDRLNLYLLNKRGPNGKRQYFQNRLGRDNMREVYRCVLNGLGLRGLVPHLGP